MSDVSDDADEFFDSSTLIEIAKSNSLQNESSISDSDNLSLKLTTLKPKVNEDLRKVISKKLEGRVESEDKLDERTIANDFAGKLTDERNVKNRMERSFKD